MTLKETEEERIKDGDALEMANTVVDDDVFVSSTFLSCP